MTTCRDCGAPVQRNTPRGVLWELDLSLHRLTHRCPEPPVLDLDAAYDEERDA